MFCFFAVCLTYLFLRYFHPIQFVSCWPSRIVALKDSENSVAVVVVVVVVVVVEFAFPATISL